MIMIFPGGALGQVRARGLALGLGLNLNFGPFKGWAGLWLSDKKCKAQPRSAQINNACNVCNTPLIEIVLFQTYQFQSYPFLTEVELHTLSHWSLKWVWLVQCLIWFVQCLSIAGRLKWGNFIYKRKPGKLNVAYAEIRFGCIAYEEIPLNGNNLNKLWKDHRTFIERDLSLHAMAVKVEVSPSRFMGPTIWPAWL